MNNPGRALPLSKHARNPRSGSRASSERTRLKVLEAAKLVLAEHGYARFTLRLVASEAQLSVGNLAYHYATKRALIRDLITHLVAEYRKAVDSSMQTPPAHHSNSFASLMEWLVRDSVSATTGKLFREFWALALRDRVIADAIDEFYDQMRWTIERRLQETFPTLRKPKARAVAQLVGIISEGANALYGTTKKRRVPLTQIIHLATELLVQAASKPEP